MKTRTPGAAGGPGETHREVSASAGFEHGLRVSLVLAAAVAFVAALAATRMAGVMGIYLHAV
ncbi:hypothetical protein AB0K16_42395 [Nonomuraea jabiensis]|uniref:hypothetical protein n=1 Tax=Nonomuraea jabiensis TaxID=882448 RepID=UPI00342BCFB0